jgi:hypothetical protein
MFRSTAWLLAGDCAQFCAHLLELSSSHLQPVTSVTKRVR